MKPDTKIPGNWAAYFRVHENKQERFHFLSDQLGIVDVDLGHVISTKGESVVCNNKER